MPLSSRDEVRCFYDTAADDYNNMMDEEIKLPLYDDVLGSLGERISAIEGAVLDTSCGSGHMLQKFGSVCNHQRDLHGLDLSPKMVTIATQRLGRTASVWQGDMVDLAGVKDNSCAAVISFFSLHHIDETELLACFAEWNRVLVERGQLVIAAWEGEGAIDYGDENGVSNRRYKESELLTALQAVGFQIDSHSVSPVEGFDMDAIHISASKVAS